MTQPPIALATHTFSGLMGTPDRTSPRRWEGFATYMDLAVEAGYAGVDISAVAFPADATDQWWREVGALVSERGLRVASVNSLRSSLCDPDYAELGFGRGRRAMEIAGILGSDTMNIAVGVPWERLDANEFVGAENPPGGSRTATAADYKATAAGLDRLSVIGADLGVSLVLELHYCSIADSVAGITGVLEHMRRPVLINPDLVNEAWGYREPPETWQDALTTLAPLAGGVWHVKNCAHGPQGPDPRPIDAPLDEGIIDYEFAWSVLREASFSGWIDVESCGSTDYRGIALDGATYFNRLTKGTVA